MKVQGEKLGYADDIAVLSVNKESLIEKIIKQILKLLRMEVNITKIMAFGGKEQYQKIGI